MIDKSVPVEWVQRLCNIAPSRKDAEPVGWLYIDSIGDKFLCLTKPADHYHVDPLYLHPPEADKLLRDLLDLHDGPVWEQRPDVFEKRMNAIRTYLEGKK